MNIKNKQDLNLTIYFAKPGFFIGELINGMLILETKMSSVIEKIVFEISMTQECKIDSNIPAKILQNLGTFNLDLTDAEALAKINDGYLMNAGKNAIPFNLKLEQIQYPSFEFPLGDKHAFVRYHFNVRIYSNYFNQVFWKHYLNLMSRPILNFNKELLTKTSGKNIKKWNLIGEGYTILIVSLPENSYTTDCQINVKITVDNTNGKEQAKEAKVKLTRNIKFYGDTQNESFSEKMTVFETKVKTPVPPGKKQDFKCLVSLKEQNIKRYIYHEIIPDYIDTNNINYYMPSIRTKIFSCQYELKITLYFNSFVSYNDRPRIKFPIIIAHQSVTEYQKEIQKQNELNNINNNKHENIKNKKCNNNNNQEKKIENKNNNDVEYKKDLNYPNLEDSLPSLESIQSAHNKKVVYDINNIEDYSSKKMESNSIPFSNRSNDNLGKNMNPNNFTRNVGKNMPSMPKINMPKL